MSIRVRDSGRRFRFGRVSDYLHHGAWWVYYRESGKAVRKKAAPGCGDAERVTAQINGHLIDIAPTLLEATGTKYPETFWDKPIQPLEGRSLVPAFADKPIGSDALYWEHEENAAVRAGDWKLVRLGNKGPGNSTT